MMQESSLYSVNSSPSESSRLVSQSSVASTRENGRLSGRCFATLTIFNVAGTIALVAAGYFTHQTYQQPKPSLRDLTIYQVNAGILLRTLVEANISAFKQGNSRGFFIEDIHQFMSVFSLEIYEILWNSSLNITNGPAQAILTAARQSFLGYVLVGDLANLFKLKRADRPKLTLIPEVPTIQNRFLGPSFNHTKGQVTVHVVTTILGVSIIALGKIFSKDVQGLELLSECLGSFLATQGIGYFAMDTFLRLWKKHEEAIKDQIEIESSEVGPSRSCSTKAVRTFLKVARSLCAETVCSLPIFFKASFIPFFVLGPVYGTLMRSSQEEFQTLTPSMLNQREAKNFTVSAMGQRVLRLAVKIQKAASIAFFALFIAWFSYGLFESGNKERLEIGIFMGATLFSALVGRILNHYFTPGRNGRLFNEAYYQMLYNIYFRVIVYQAIKQITFINDTNLNQDTSLDLASGLFALSLFGDQLGINQIRDYQENEFCSPFFRSLAFAEIFQGLNNKFSHP